MKRVVLELLLATSVGRRDLGSPSVIGSGRAGLTHRGSGPGAALRFSETGEFVDDDLIISHGNTC